MPGCIHLSALLCSFCQLHAPALRLIIRKKSPAGSGICHSSCPLGLNLYIAYFCRYSVRYSLYLERLSFLVRDTYSCTSRSLLAVSMM